jgi:hypothetical protein
MMPTILDNPTLLRIRRNHALEHATIHLLSARVPRTVLIGRSDARGFYLAGEVSSEALQHVVHQALVRLQSGESGLAVHPNCGTNLMTGAILAGSASFLAAAMMRRRRRSDWLEQWPAALVAAALGLLVAQPLGTSIQRRVTTAAQPGELRILSVRRLRASAPTLHRVLTES